MRGLDSSKGKGVTRDAATSRSSLMPLENLKHAAERFDRASRRLEKGARRLEIF